MAEREHFQEVLIKDISFENHRVCVSGQIVGSSADSFFVDDGTGQILVKSNNKPPSDFVKVFGRLLAYENGFELQAEIIKDYSKVDKELLRKVKELLRMENQKLI